VGEITLVIVSKGQPIEGIKTLYDLGERDFGENRAQELAAKVGQLPADIKWHFVGPLQSNKARIIRPIVTLLHSLDRVNLAPSWIKGPGLAPPALLQVNIGHEEQKHGVDPADAARVLTELLDLGVDVRGLMAIPPAVDTAEAARPYFARLRDLGALLAEPLGRIPDLSMGMTDDFEVAIEEGATFVRVGRAIFWDN
jgi:hypothetical protein